MANTGNQVRSVGNSKGTGTRRKPSAMALASKKQTKPASENPDGKRNRP